MDSLTLWSGHAKPSLLFSPWRYLKSCFSLLSFKEPKGWENEECAGIHYPPKAPQIHLCVCEGGAFSSSEIEDHWRVGVGCFLCKSLGGGNPFACLGPQGNSIKGLLFYTVWLSGFFVLFIKQPGSGYKAAGKEREGFSLIPSPTLRPSVDWAELSFCLLSSKISDKAAALLQRICTIKSFN